MDVIQSLIAEKGWETIDLVVDGSDYSKSLEKRFRETDSSNRLCGTTTVRLVYKRYCNTKIRHYLID